MNTVSRKRFLQQSALAGLMLALADTSILAADAHKKINFGLITGVINSELKQDWEGTLRKVAAMGYKYLEFGKHFGTDRDYFKKYIKKLGLQPLAGGAAMAQMRKEEDLKKMIDDALYLGKKYLVCYWPWMDDGKNKKSDDFKKASEDLNKVGEQCSKGGIHFLFHNHDQEFLPVEGHQWGYNIMMEQTDPANVAMLLDLYWCTKGGANPLQLLDQYPTRFQMFHVKDMDKTSERSYTCPGYGVIDFQTIFKKALKAGIKYYTVEIDKAPNPMQCIEDSHRYLKSLKL